MQVALIHNTPLFFSERDGHWFPTLRILHQYPDMMPKLRTDQGAIKFVLSGANIMCPGLTSPGATMHDEVSCQSCNHQSSIVGDLLQKFPAVVSNSYHNLQYLCSAGNFCAYAAHHPIASCPDLAC